MSALLVSLNDKGRVDLDYIVRLRQQPEPEVLAALDGLIYETPIRLIARSVIQRQGYLHLNARCLEG